MMLIDDNDAVLLGRVDARWDTEC